MAVGNQARRLPALFYCQTRRRAKQRRVKRKIILVEEILHNCTHDQDRNGSPQESSITAWDCPTKNAFSAEGWPLERSPYYNRETRTFKTRWLFVCIGGVPHTEWAIEAGACPPWFGYPQVPTDRISKIFVLTFRAKPPC